MCISDRLDDQDLTLRGLPRAAHKFGRAYSRIEEPMAESESETGESWSSIWKGVSGP